MAARYATGGAARDVRPVPGNACARQMLHNARVSMPRWPEALGDWTLSPVADVLVLFALVWYLVAARRDGSWPRWRAVCFVAGLAVVVISLDSALGVYGHHVFWMHMVQHLALITVAPALLVLGHPLDLLRRGGDRGRRAVEALRRNTVVAVLTHPLVAFAAYAAVLVGTHLTGFMAAMPAHPWLGPVEETLYLVSGYLFALPLLAWEPLRWNPPHPVRMMLVLVSMVVDTFVGIVLMLTSDETYVGGAIMWFGGDGLMMVIALVIAGRWVADPGHGADTGAFLDAARRSALASYGADEDAADVLDSQDVDEDERARLAYNRMLAALDDRHRRTRR